MVLLDTHALLWFLNDDERLSYRAKEFIENEENVFVSIASFWEISIKASRGNLDIPFSISQLMIECQKLKFTILHISGEDLDRLRDLTWIHRDPFDRIIIAQAMEKGLALITKDENIRRYDLTTIW